MQDRLEQLSAFAHRLTTNKKWISNFSFDLNEVSKSCARSLRAVVVSQVRSLSSAALRPKHPGSAPRSLM